MDRRIELKKGSRFVRGRTLSPKNLGSGYLAVVLCRDSLNKQEYIHRLVASAFVDNPNNYKYVNHIDGNPSNNHADNLEWVSHRQNVQHAYDTGLNSNKGGNHTFAVGVVDNQLGREFSSIRDWAEARNINYHTARNVVNGYSSLKEVDKTLIIKLKNPTTNEKNDDTQKP
ncbi:MAG: HNH endonuclease [Flavipsychrobacter sp.]|nr:HNH endonuclease [Flavipsychrobacter sp.]